MTTIKPVMNLEYRDPNNPSSVFKVSTEVRTIMRNMNFEDETEVSYANLDVDAINEWGLANNVPALGIASKIQKRYLDAYQFMTENPNYFKDYIQKLREEMINGQNRSAEEPVKNEDVEDSVEKTDSNQDASTSFEREQPVINTIYDSDDEIEDDSDDDSIPYDISLNQVQNDENIERHESDSENVNEQSDTNTGNHLTMDDLMNTVDSEGVPIKIDSGDETNDMDDSKMIKDTYPYFTYNPEVLIRIGDLSTHFLNNYSKDKNGNSVSDIRLNLPPLIFELLMKSVSSLYSERVWESIIEATFKLKAQICILTLMVRSASISPTLFNVIINDLIITRVNRNDVSRKKYEDLGSYSEVIRSDYFKKDKDLIALLRIKNGRTIRALNSEVSEDASQRRIESELVQQTYMIKSLIAGIAPNNWATVLDNKQPISQITTHMDNKMVDILSERQTRKRTNQLRKK